MREMQKISTQMGISQCEKCRNQRSGGDLGMREIQKSALGWGSRNARNAENQHSDGDLALREMLKIQVHIVMSQHETVMQKIQAQMRLCQL